MWAGRYWRDVNSRRYPHAGRSGACGRLAGASRGGSRASRGVAGGSRGGAGASRDGSGGSRDVSRASRGGSGASRDGSRASRSGPGARRKRSGASMAAGRRAAGAAGQAAGRRFREWDGELHLCFRSPFVAPRPVLVLHGLPPRPFANRFASDRTLRLPPERFVPAASGSAARGTVPSPADPFVFLPTRSFSFRRVRFPSAAFDFFPRR